MTQETAIEIRDLVVEYGNRRILNSIDLDIPLGQISVIMGGSGAGKSTLLRSMLGLKKPTSGAIRMLGTDICTASPGQLQEFRKQMGVAFQGGALFTDMDVFENIAFQMREHTDLPDDAIRDLVLMKLNAVGLRGAARLMPSELSGGMARRVALARAVALDPMLVMYDEPFAGLDPISLGVIGQLIRRSNDALGATSIVVTHDVMESLKIVDYVYLMSEGRIVAQGTPEEMRASAVPMVHQFIQGEADGPVPFHYPADDYGGALGLA